jgi:hypothetical protein
MRRWIGRWLAGVGLIHTAFAFVVFTDPLLGMLRDGLLNTAELSPGRPLAFWFLFSGLLLVPVGMLVDWIETQPSLQLPRFFGYWLLGLTALGCIVMPVSGFWLLVPPTFRAVGMRLQRTPAREQLLTVDEPASVFSAFLRLQRTWARH